MIQAKQIKTKQIKKGFYCGQSGSFYNFRIHYNRPMADFKYDEITPSGFQKISRSIFIDETIHVKIINK